MACLEKAVLSPGIVRGLSITEFGSFRKHCIVNCVLQRKALAHRTSEQDFLVIKWLFANNLSC